MYNVNITSCWFDLCLSDEGQCPKFLFPSCSMGLIKTESFILYTFSQPFCVSIHSVLTNLEQHWDDWWLTE